MIKVLAIPKDPNPYQSLLADALRDQGVGVRYLVGPTRSHTVNVLCRPLMLVWHRATGVRILHVHWTYDFVPHWAARRSVGRRLAEAWFLVVLEAAGRLGFRLVWTAHNVVPHERIFHDDVRARRRLARAADLVLLHSESSVRAVEQMGARLTAVVPQGTNYPTGGPRPTRAVARQRFGFADPTRVVLCFGKVRPYKGVEDLLRAWAGADPDMVLFVAGACDDEDLLRSLRVLAEHCGSEVTLELRHLEEERLLALVSAADVAIFPFLGLTNSGSVLYALSAGIAIVIPDAPALDHIPEHAAIRYASGNRDALAQVLRQVSAMSDEALREIGEGGRAFARTLSWANSAEVTADLFRRILGDTVDRRMIEVP